jgi:hypothetical protein
VREERVLVLWLKPQTKIRITPDRDRGQEEIGKGKGKSEHWVTATSCTGKKAKTLKPHQARSAGYISVIINKIPGFPLESEVPGISSVIPEINRVPSEFSAILFGLPCLIIL